MDTPSITKLLNNEHFKNYLDTTPNPNKFINRLEKISETNKIGRLLRCFPEELSEDKIYSSLLMNINMDYNEVFQKVPTDFEINESINRIHTGNANQIGINFKKNIPKEKKNLEEETRRIACASFYFLDTEEGKKLLIENIQGDIHRGTGWYTDREIMRVFGKLNTFYKTNWRVGILQQVYDYGKMQKAEVKGIIPGLFALWSVSIQEYPMYALDYLSTYLKIGIPLENIEFKNATYQNINPNWQNIIPFLEKKTTEEKIQIVRDAANAYRKAFKTNRDGWLFKNAITMEEYKSNCINAYERIFSTMLCEK